MRVLNLVESENVSAARGRNAHAMQEHMIQSGLNWGMTGLLFNAIARGRSSDMARGFGIGFLLGAVYAFASMAVSDFYAS